MVESPPIEENEQIASDLVVSSDDGGHNGQSDGGHDASDHGGGDNAGEDCGGFDGDGG